MQLHPATIIILDKDDIEQAIKQLIREEYPEYSVNHNIIIDTNLEKVNVRTVCYTPIRKREE